VVGEKICVDSEENSSTPRTLILLHNWVVPHALLKRNLNKFLRYNMNVGSPK
jgi:hypothetical protein